MAGINIFPQDLDTKGKTVLLRLDLNVPIKNSIIQDHTRIEQILPFLKKLIEKKTKIIIISHLGRPKGIRDSNFSLKPVFNYLKNNLNTGINFYDGEINDELKAKSSFLRESEILFLENIRFFKEETDNDENFSKKLGSLAEIYVNDAFSCSHRKQASIYSITKFVKKAYARRMLFLQI